MGACGAAQAHRCAQSRVGTRARLLTAARGGAIGVENMAPRLARRCAKAGGKTGVRDRPAAIVLRSSPDHHQVGGMTKYNVHPGEDDTGFDISIISDNGARQTVLGFRTVAVADAWIAEDKRLTALANETERPGSDLPPAREA